MVRQVGIPSPDQGIPFVEGALIQPSYEGHALYPSQDSDPIIAAAILAKRLADQRASIDIAERILGTSPSAHPVGSVDTAQSHAYSDKGANVAPPQSSPDAKIIRDMLDRADRNNRVVKLTPAGNRPPVLTRQPASARLDAGNQASQKLPEPIDAKERKPIFKRHPKVTVLGAAALASIIAVNVVPPAREFAQKFPVVERLVFVGDNPDTESTPSAETTTATIIESLQNMAVTPQPLIDKPMLISEPAPGQTTPELSQQVNLTIVTPEGEQLTLDNMLRLTVQNPILGALTYKINPENIESNLTYAGDGTYNLSLTALTPTALFISGIKPDGSLITAADIESGNTPKSVILGGNPTDYLWKAVTPSGTADNDQAVIDFINSQYGANAEAINKAMAENALSIASGISRQAAEKIFDEIFFVDSINTAQSQINAVANSKLPENQSVNIVITYSQEDIAEFVAKSHSSYTKLEKPLTPGMTYSNELTGLKAPSLDTA